jgi:hypothetical protein
MRGRRGQPMTTRFIRALSAALLFCSACRGAGDDDTDTGGMSDAERSKFLKEAEEKQLKAIEPKIAFAQGLRGKLPPPTGADGVKLDGDWIYDWWVHEEDLAALATKPTGARVEDAHKIQECAAEMQNKGAHNGTTLGDCEKARFLFVVRVAQRLDAKVTDIEDDLGQKQFVEGSVQGDVVVYDLKDSKQIGGFRWAATSSDTVKANDLGPDLDRNMLQAITEAERTFVTHP